ncbi:MAG: hypothetical protein ACOC2U_05215 [bacterium]
MVSLIWITFLKVQRKTGQVLVNMVWALMNFSLAIIFIGISVLVSQKYFNSEYNHIENMWFSVAFFVFAINHTITGISYFSPSVQINLISFNILKLYGYWIFILMGFRLRQIHQNWPYKLNKYIRVVVLIVTIFSLFIYHLFAVYEFYHTMVLYYHAIFVFLSLLAFLLFPTTGYYVFFRLGFGMIGLSHVFSIGNTSIEALKPFNYTPNILSFFGFLSVIIALYFIFYSDNILEKRAQKYERRQKSRRREDKTSF